MIRVVGRWSREQVVVLDVVMMSLMREESAVEKAVRGEGSVDLAVLVLKAERKDSQRSGEEGGCVWGLKELVGGKQEAGVPVGTVDEGRKVGRFGSQESITVGEDVSFVGFSMDSEASSLVESFEFAAGLLPSAEFRVYQGAGWVKDTEAVFHGARESRESDRGELSWVT